MNPLEPSMSDPSAPSSNTSDGQVAADPFGVDPPITPDELWQMAATFADWAAADRAEAQS